MLQFSPAFHAEEMFQPYVVFNFTPSNSPGALIGRQCHKHCDWFEADLHIATFCDTIIADTNVALTFNR